ncbi:MAG TPA: hypothetical protein VEI97_07210, partial [bacterium]|nr:hypothetical protein [bacterium]
MGLSPPAAVSQLCPALTHAPVRPLTIHDTHFVLNDITTWLPGANWVPEARLEVFFTSLLDAG